MIEALAILGLSLATVVAFLLGERFSERRRAAEVAELRAIWEGRFDLLLSNMASERELLRLAADAERGLYRHDIDKLNIKNQMLLDQAANEREGLLTRIQAWSPAPPTADPAEKTTGSHIAGESEETLNEQELTKLRAEGLEPTLDGNGFLDTRNGCLYEDPEEARIWRKYCKDNGLPESTNPRTYMSKQD